MRSVRMTALACGLTVLAATAVAAPAAPVGAGPAAAAPTAAAPTAHTVESIPSVGPLFFPSLLGLAPALGLPHFCTASVVHSAGRNLVLTAAHCLTGPGLGVEFAPGYHDGDSPYGVWSVSRIYVDPTWIRNQDPQHDVAILQMAPHAGRQLEELTGAATLGAAPPAGTPVTVDGYVAGSGGRPITCAAPIYYTAGFPSFDCGGYAAGVSGGPWLAGGAVVGVTGGLHQGGCTDTTSYSAAFGVDVAALLARARKGGAGDFAPLPGSDGC